MEIRTALTEQIIVLILSGWSKDEGNSSPKKDTDYISFLQISTASAHIPLPGDEKSRANFKAARNTSGSTRDKLLHLLFSFRFFTLTKSFGVYPTKSIFPENVPAIFSKCLFLSFSISSNDCSDAEGLFLVLYISVNICFFV